MGCILKRLILLHSTVHINRTPMTLLQACTIASVNGLEYCEPMYVKA